MASEVGTLWRVHDLLLQAAQRFPDKPCLVYRGQTLSYNQVLSDVRELAAILANAGIGPGDRVAIYFEKSVEEAVALLAVSMAGGIFIDINPLQKPKQVCYILKDSGARFLITSYQRLRTISSDLHESPELTTIIASGSRTYDNNATPTGINVLSWQDTKSQIFSQPEFPIRIDVDPAAIIYTSGSTGMPKGVVLSHRNIIEGAKIIATYLHNTENDRILSVLPFSFDVGMNQLTTSLLVGGNLVLLNYLTPQDIINALQKERITGLAGIPTIWSQLLQYKWSNAQFPDFRYITNTGGRFPEQMVHEYRRRLPHTQIYLMYGLTEAFRSTYLEPDQVDKRASSIGKAIPNTEILILDENGKKCAPGAVGELVHRGALVAQGYWNDPERTRERFRPNPLQPGELQNPEIVVFSGDYVKQDEEGYIYFVGRKDDMMKTSGFRVSPTEIEELFYNTGKVKHAVALGIPDEEKGESIKVIVVVRPETQIGKEELLNLVSKDCPHYMIPKEIEIRDFLPHNPNGKIDRSALRKQEVEAKV